jgi:transcriptional regulator with PAS, ATPase and Fis domain
LHRASPRRDGPFLRLNCAALPESLLESELFGHERGAFTGAHALKIGLLEATDGGTVFLDEIGELPLGTQAKLLRVLEERIVTRVGSTKTKRIDVRFVTATNRDLSKEVKNGRFRGDLYYRISGLVVRLPALRQRPSEVEPLARHFLRGFCERSGQPEPELLAPALERLKAHQWPGNVRELKNVMERAALLANHGVIVRGTSVAQAFDDLYYLERACMLQVTAQATGRRLRVVPDEIARHTASQMAGESQQALLHLQALQRILDRESRPIPHRRPRDGQQRARAAARQAARLHERDLLPAHACAYHFFLDTSFSTSMSSVRSATSFFSRPFSCSSCLSRRTSAGSKLPKCFRHA